MREIVFYWFYFFWVKFRFGCCCFVGFVVGVSLFCLFLLFIMGFGYFIYSLRMSITSVRFSKISCSVMTLGCSICRRMFIFRWIFFRYISRRLVWFCRFLMNLVAYFSSVFFFRYFFTMVNWLLWGYRFI